jgi:hypothetical protein
MDIIRPFLIGGSVIGGAKLISRYMDPALAPLLGGMPTGIIASFFLDNDKEKRQYFKGYGVSTSILVIAILMLVYGTRVLTNIHVDVIAASALIVWAVLSYISINYFIVKK